MKSRLGLGAPACPEAFSPQPTTTAVLAQGQAVHRPAAMATKPAVGLGQHVQVAVRIPPGDQAAAGGQGQAVQVARRDGDAGFADVGHIALALAVQAPGDHGAVLLQPQAVIQARRHRDEIAVGFRHRRTAPGCCSPRPRSLPVLLQAQAVILARGQGHEAAVGLRAPCTGPGCCAPRRSRCRSVFSPRLCPAPAATERKLEFCRGRVHWPSVLLPQACRLPSARTARLCVVPGGDGRDTRGRRRERGLAELRIAPGEGRAVLTQPQAECSWPGGQMRHQGHQRLVEQQYAAPRRHDRDPSATAAVRPKSNRAAQAGGHS
jgi:hypothetical protein